MDIIEIIGWMVRVSDYIGLFMENILNCIIENVEITAPQVLP